MKKVLLGLVLVSVFGSCSKMTEGMYEFTTKHVESNRIQMGTSGCNHWPIITREEIMLAQKMAQGGIIVKQENEYCSEKQARKKAEYESKKIKQVICGNGCYVEDVFRVDYKKLY